MYSFRSENTNLILTHMSFQPCNSHIPWAFSLPRFTMRLLTGIGNFTSAHSCKPDPGISDALRCVSLTPHELLLWLRYATFMWNYHSNTFVRAQLQFQLLYMDEDVDTKWGTRHENSCSQAARSNDSPCFTTGFIRSISTPHTPQFLHVSPNITVLWAWVLS